MNRRQLFAVAAGVGIVGVFNTYIRSNNINGGFEIEEEDNLLFIPPLLDQPLSDFYQLPSITIQDTLHEFFLGIISPAIGLSTQQQTVSYLGPTIKVKRGDVVDLTIRNESNESRSNHWHGLRIPSCVDGGPHQLIKPGESRTVTLHIQQEASTCWYHPFNYKVGAKHLYLGQAGMFIIEDDNSASLNLPNTYGVDDIPLIIQDKLFDDNGKQTIDTLNDTYIKGNTIVVNGTINPYVSASPGWLRLRLLNASYGCIFELSLSNNKIFYKIATDGGLLNEPLAVNTFVLSPGERCEIMVYLEEEQENIALLIASKILNSMNIHVDTINNIPIAALKINIEDVACTDATLLSSLRKNLINVNYGLAGMLPVTKEIVNNLTSYNNQGFNSNSLFDIEKIDETIIRENEEIWEVNFYGVCSFHIYGCSFLVISVDNQLPDKKYNGWQDTLLINGSDGYGKNKTKKVKLLIKFLFSTYRSGVNAYEAAVNPTSLKYNIPYLYHFRSLDALGDEKIGQFTVSDKY